MHLILLSADCTSMLIFLTCQPDLLLSQVELLLLHVSLELKHLLLAFFLLCTRPEVQEFSACVFLSLSAHAFLLSLVLQNMFYSKPLISESTCWPIGASNNAVYCLHLD